MREIKFRAWSNETSKMMGWADIQRFKNLQKLIGLNHVDVMQFTGLTDKNGKEIYKSDLLKDSAGNILLVVWREDLASFALRKDGWMYDHYFGEAVDAGHCEVIGNIYETPELLK